VTTIDEMINEIVPPDIIKIDVEGAELLVLRGGKDFLQHKSPKLLLEIHNITLMHDIVNLLRDLNYDTNILDEENAELSRCFITAQKPNNIIL